MCDFPIRRESGTGNRIPGDFFVSFFGRAKKEMPRRHEASGATGAPRHERTKKEQTPVGDRHIIKLTVKWPGHALRPSGRAGRSLPQRRPAHSHSSFPFPAGCAPRQTTGLLIVYSQPTAILVYREKVTDPGMCDFPIRRESGAGNRIPGDFFAYFFGRAKK